MPVRVLLLAGTTEAIALARQLATDDRVAVTASFAGRTNQRAALPATIELRVGGFGGADGLGRYLVDEQIDAVLDVTHPFAARMPFNAAGAATVVGCPLLRVLRPAWSPETGDQWIDVADLGAAAVAINAVGAHQVLLTTGRQELAPFRVCRNTELVVRCIEPPEPGALDAAEVILARGPFDFDGELALLRSRQIDLIVAKNAGGSGTSAKLAAARSLGIRVVMVQRPPQPEVETVTTVAGAVAWLGRLIESDTPRRRAGVVSEGLRHPGDVGVAVESRTPAGFSQPVAGTTAVGTPAMGTSGAGSSADGTSAVPR